MSNFEFLSLVYWFAGFGLVVHGCMTMNPDTTVAGVGILVVALICLVAAVMGVPMDNDKNQLDRGE